MALTPGSFHHLGALDGLAALDSPVHRLDPRAKVLATLLFVLAVASFSRYEVAALVPYALFPAALASLGGIPPGAVLRRTAAAAPFVLLLAAFNPVLDRAPMVQLGPWALSAGWVSFASILLRCALTVSAALVLVATTSFDGICAALERLGLPAAFTRQAAFLHRYAFLLGDETLRLHRARTLRANGRRATLSEFASLGGHLLLRAWDRARRIHVAMESRGFQGRLPGRPGRAWGKADLAFLLLWAAFFAALRAWNLPRFLGGLVS